METYEDFRVGWRVEGGRAVVEVVGEVDLATQVQLWNALENAARSSSEPVILDLSRCSFLEVTGAQCIVQSARHLARQGRTLTIRGSSDRIRRLFELLGLLTSDLLRFEEAGRPEGGRVVA